MLRINRGEAKRLVTDSQWNATIDDIADLIRNSKSNLSHEDDRRFATRAISFVLQNLESRGQIENAFINVREEHEDVSR